MSLHIRPVRDDDIEDLARLSLLAWRPIFSSFEQILGPEIYPIIYPDWLKTQREAVETVCKDGEETLVWVGTVDGIVVGFVAYKLHKDETGEVYLLAVHPECQNDGIGAELNNFTEKDARKRYENGRGRDRRRSISRPGQKIVRKSRVYGATVGALLQKVVGSARN